jgi:hypothetical protein
VVPVGNSPAGRDELRYLCRHVRVSRRELARGGEPGAAVDVIVRATFGLPSPGRGAQLAVEDQVGASLLEPRHQPRPGAEHHLVNHVHHPVVALDEPGVDERLDGRTELDRQLLRSGPAGAPTGRRR